MRKKNLKIINAISRMGFLFIFFFSLFGVFYSLNLFWIGYHNLDSSQNMRWLETEFNLTLVDYYDYNKYFTSVEGYILGVDQLTFGFRLMFISSLFLGITISELYNMKGGTKEK